MEKLTRSEMKIFELIKAGKTKEEILNEKITTASNLNFLLTQIYKKTDDIVGYRTAKDKYNELVCFMRNHPHIFSITPKKGKKIHDQILTPNMKIDCYSMITN